MGWLSSSHRRFGAALAHNIGVAAPKIVHAFMPRDTKGYSIKETWDVLGMRGTRSDDTVLEGRLCLVNISSALEGEGSGGGREPAEDLRCAVLCEGLHQRGLRLRQPVSDLHGAEEVDGGGQIVASLLRSAAPGI